jgi:ketosteroid isomerase-like protein
VEIVPPAGPPPADPSASQPASTVAETPRPADPIPDAPREPPPPPPPAVTERPRIEAALAAYAAAYSNLDADAVARVYPSVDIGALRRAFGDARELDLQVDIQLVKVSGDTAVVSATVRQRFQGSVGAAQSSSTKAEFLMQKTSGTWLIATRK